MSRGRRAPNVPRGETIVFYESAAAQPAPSARVLGKGYIRPSIAAKLSGLHVNTIYSYCAMADPELTAPTGPLVGHVYRDDFGHWCIERIAFEPVRKAHKTPQIAT